MPNLRVLYVAPEIAPFLNTSSVAPFVGKLAPAIHGKNVEIRILVPRFGLINERRNKLHEVVRLSGANIKIGTQVHNLVVKVTTIPGTRIQVYFIDNEFYFRRKSVFKDKEGILFSDNDERLIFVCKGVLEILKKLNWVPNVVHCHDWITALIPLYLKRIFADDPTFQHTKVLFNIYDTAFQQTFTDNFAEKASLQHDDMHNFASPHTIGFNELIQLGANHADVVIQSEPIPTTDLNQLLNKKDILHITHDEAGIELYHKLYKELSPS